MSAPYADIEMECYCEHCKCKNYTRYRHHDDWSEESDFACDKCLETCYKQKECPGCGENEVHPNCECVRPPEDCRYD